jgi:hypothetical protein
VRLLVEAVRQRRRRRLIDDARDFEAGDLAGVFRRLSLGVVEIGRDGDDRLVHLVTEVSFGRFLQLAQNLRRNFGRGEFLPADVDLHVILGSAYDFVGDNLLFGGDFVVPPSHEPLDRIHGLGWVRDGLPAG